MIIITQFHNSFIIILMCMPFKMFRIFSTEVIYDILFILTFDIVLQIS